MAGTILPENTIDAYGRRSDNARTVRTSTLSSSATSETDAVDVTDATKIIKEPKARDQKKVANNEQEDDLKTPESAEDKENLRKIDEAIARCRELYRNPLISDRTRMEYERDWENLRAERKVEWMQQNVSFLLQTLSKAEAYKTTFASKLDDAVSHKWISNTSRAQWWARFNDPNTLEWTRKEWLENEFPKLLANWREVAEEREYVLHMAQKFNLTRKDIPELGNLLNQHAFLSLHYLSRKDQVAQARALVLAKINNKEAAIEAVKSRLNAVALDGIMHMSKVGPWMKRAMKSGDPQKFLEQVIEPFIANWAAVRAEFDEIQEKMDELGVPRGFRPVKEHDFLLMEYKQRTSYCALAKLRLKNVDDTNKKLASFKLRIRHNLDMQDWEGAEEDIQTALSQWPTDNELLSMRTYLECHRTQKEAHEKKETPSPDQLNAELRTLLRNVPGNLHWLYRETMQKGPKVFHRMAQIVANGPWAKNHGYTSEAKKQADMENEYNKQKTNDYICNGHTNTIEHNVLAGDTAVEGAIHDDCTKPQYIYTSSVGKEAVFKSVSKNAENESFGYWSIWLSDDISLDLQESICKNLNNPIKTRLRQLDSLGYRFTETGPIPKAGTIVDPSNG